MPDIIYPPDGQIAASWELLQLFVLLAVPCVVVLLSGAAWEWFDRG